MPPSRPDHLSLARGRVADQIIGLLQAQIGDGTFPRGSKLPSERELAERYEVSSPTVREALRALTAMGLVEVRHGSGAYVAATSEGLLDGALAMLVQLESVGVLDLINLLEVLNLYVGDLAVTQADDADVHRVLAAAEATAHAASVDEVNAAITEFLVAFVACAHQPLLDAICGFLVRMVIRIETSSNPARSARYWQRWSADTSVYRIAVARAREQRDAERLRFEVTTFHRHIRDRMEKVPGLVASRIPDRTMDAFRTAAGGR